jgi:hypothetical protein
VGKNPERSGLYVNLIIMVRSLEQIIYLIESITEDIIYVARQKIFGMQETALRLRKDSKGILSRILQGITQHMRRSSRAYVSRSAAQLAETTLIRVMGRAEASMAASLALPLRRAATDATVGPSTLGSGIGTDLW